MVKNIGSRISEENPLIVLAEIMEVVIGAKITGYMHLRYSKKLLMRSWQNMRKEAVDEKVVLCLFTTPKRRRSSFTEEIDTVSVIEKMVKYYMNAIRMAKLF